MEFLYKLLHKKMSEEYVGTMDDMCKLLNPQLSLGPACMNWFHDATEHCSKVLFDLKTPYNMFWHTIKQYIYPVVDTQILHQVPIHLHPQFLSANECSIFISDIVRQYTRQAPLFAATTIINDLLWEVIYRIGSILIMVLIIVLCYFISFREKQPQVIRTSGSPRLQLEQQIPVARTTQVAQVPCQMHCIREQMRHSLSVALHELRRLHVNQMLRPEDVLAPDGSPVLVLRMSSKLDVLNSIVVRSEYTLAQLFRRQDNAMLQPNNNKAETILEIMKFIDKKCFKLHVLMCFGEDDPTFEEVESQLKPAVKPAPKPAVEPAAEPAVEPTPKPAVKPAAELVVEPAPKPAAEPAAEPVSNPEPQPKQQPKVKKMRQPEAVARKSFTAIPFKTKRSPPPGIQPSKSAVALMAKGRQELADRGNVNQRSSKSLPVVPSLIPRQVRHSAESTYASGDHCAPTHSNLRYRKRSRPSSKTEPNSTLK